MANVGGRKEGGGGNALCSHLFECVLKQFFWPIEQAQQQRLTNAVPLERVRGRGRAGRSRVSGGGGGVLTPATELCRNTCKCQRGKSSIIDRCTERSLATVAAGAMPIKIGSATAATAAMSRRVGLSTCPADECAHNGRPFIHAKPTECQSS